MLKAALLDLDGTLIDTPQAIVEVAQATMGELGRPPVSEVVMRNGIGLPLPVALAEAMGIPVEHPEVERARQIYSRVWRATVSPRLHALLFPGVLDALGELRRANLRLGVVTGKAQEGADLTVDGAGLRPFMEVVLGYNAVKNPKPAPDLALEALRQMDVAPRHAVVVGDSSLDILMAKAAAVRSIAVSCGAQPARTLQAASPDWLVPAFSDAARILLDLCKEP